MRLAPVWDSTSCHARPINYTMLLTIFFIIIILWLAGVVMAYTLGGLIHLLLLLGVIILFIEYLERRKVI